MKLVEQARQARERASAPYSGYRVGAACLGDNGKVYHGGNVEAACSSVGICAERVAIAKCVTDGAEPVHIALIADAEQPVTPCGICRQFMLEFAPLKVTMANLGGKTKTTTANKLLPLKFERRKRK